VTGFGSVIVNGVRYDTSSSSFTIDGQPGTEDEIEVGDVVLVQGTIATSGTTGTATSVRFDDNVEGPIEPGSIDTVTSTLVVLGQTVRIDADTSFDDSISPPSLAGLSEGDVIEVSGFVAANGDIRATRIEPKAPGGELEITGIVAGVTATTFMINALTVNYETATLDDFPAGTISDGDLVEAKGTTIDPDTGELIATRVELKGDLAGNDNDHVEIEGLITRFVSATDFDVSGLPVTTNNQTVFEGGVAADLGLNIKVEVEGALNAAGALVAEKVDIRRARLVRIEAAVDSVSAATNSFIVLGITVNTDALTRMEDKFNNPPVQPFRLTDLSAGDFVEVRGSEDPSAAGEVLAALLERDDPRETSLQGFVEDPIGEPAFTVLGVTVHTTGAQFRDVDESPLTSNEFFARLTVGRLVKADGTEAADTELAADEVEFESE